MRLTPDPVLIFVMLSWPRSLHYLVHLMQRKWAFLCLSLLSGIYVSAEIQSKKISNDQELIQSDPTSIVSRPRSTELDKTCYVN